MPRPRAHFGLALGATGVTAVRLTELTRNVAPFLEHPWSPEDDDRRDQLAAFLRALAIKAAGPSELHIALLPPLADVRLVSLPPIAPEMMRSALARDLRRYLPVDGVEMAVQVYAQSARLDGGSPPHLLLTAPESVIEDILSAAASAQWRVRSLGAAQLAWIRAARVDPDTPTTTTIRVRTSSREDSIELENDVVCSIRRMPVTANAHSTEGEECLAANEPAAMTLAAIHAETPDHTSLWPRRVHTERRVGTWRAARRTALVAGGLLMVAGAIEAFATRQRLAETLDARARVRAEVDAARVRLDSLALLHATLETLRDFSGGDWNPIALLTDIERALPDNAWLTSLQSSGDTVIIAGEADRAAPVLAALASSPALRNVRMDAPIQQHIENGDVSAERFVIVAEPRRPETRQ